MLLSVRALSKTFHLSQNGNREVTPFREVSFEVKQGTFLGITGPSGVGKSSILKCVYRTYLSTSGHIYYRSADNGVVDLAGMPERSVIHLRKREIGYVSQFLRVIPRVSALRLVAERLQSAGIARDQAADRAGAMLERMQLPRRLWDSHPASFSGGEQQRLNLARAAIVSPRLLILDEPTASLDAVSKASVLELLQDMKRQGTTMLGVFHDIAFMERIADQLLDLRVSNLSIKGQGVMTTIIRGGKLVLPDEVIEGDAVLEAGAIARIVPGGVSARELERAEEVIEAASCFVMPGMIDIHNDAAEKEVQPRPGAVFPMKQAYFELDKKLAAVGITTIYHSVRLCQGDGVREEALNLTIIESIRKLAVLRASVRHRIHLRYEITYFDGLAALERLLAQRAIQLLSYMDHTPGQGQYREVGSFKQYKKKMYGISEEDSARLIANMQKLQAKVDWSRLRQIAVAASEQGIALASHDDDSPEKIGFMQKLGLVITEFPLNLETALFARAQGIHAAVGAPNVVRGGSTGNNLRAIEAIEAKGADILCSDYSPSSMLPAVFKLAESGIGLPEAVRMVSLNPAEALGISERQGAVSPGRSADLLIVELIEGYPVVKRTLVDGHTVYRAAFVPGNR